MSKTTVNVTGRNAPSTTRRPARSGAPPPPKKKIKGPFIAHTRELLASPAWQAMSRNAQRCLTAIEIELMSPGNEGNGSLICTYDQFEARSIRRNTIRDALEELVALGLLEIVVRGHAAATDLKFPSLYRLTYVQGFDGPEPTDEWRQIKSAEHAYKAKRQADENLAAEREEKQERRAGREIKENRS